jgi:hypothetical protein
MVALVGPWLTLWIVLLIIGTMCVYAAFKISRLFHSSFIGWLGLSIFFLFNPWVYTKVVAGHIFMVLAYGATGAFVAELLQRRPRAAVLSFLLLFIVQQLQFVPFVLFFLLVRSFSVRLHETWIAAAAFVAPVAVGLTLSVPTLTGIPYNLWWQLSQSVRPQQGALLLGYFAGYTEKFNTVAIVALWVVVGLAALGLFSNLRSRLVLLTAGGLLLCLVWAGGFTTALGPIYGRFAALPGMGLFRELYDLLAFVAIGYCVLCSVAVAKIRFADVALCFAAAALATAWISAPVSRWWVDLRKVPMAAVAPVPHSRFALLPAFQPLTFHGNGSGADPEAVARADDLTPLNEYLTAYPEDVALLRFIRTGDSMQLAGLSVSQVIARPWFKTDERSLAGQTALPQGRYRSLPLPDVRRLRFLSEASLLPLPTPVALGNCIGCGNALFSDLREIHGANIPRRWAKFERLTILKPTISALRADQGWVDIRQGFLVEPELGQGLGGVLTTSSKVPLSVQGGLDTLVFLRGTLQAQNGAVVARFSHGYHWIYLPRNVTSVSCRGECAVVAQGHVPWGMRLNAEPQPASALQLHGLLPFIASTQVPPTRSSMIRYNVRFNRAWVALLDRQLLPHVRVDTIVNGWIISRHQHAGTLWFIEWVAFLQALLQVFGLIYALAVCRRLIGIRFGHLDTAG